MCCRDDRVGGSRGVFCVEELDERRYLARFDPAEIAFADAVDPEQRAAGDPRGHLVKASLDDVAAAFDLPDLVVGLNVHTRLGHQLQDDIVVGDGFSGPLFSKLTDDAVSDLARVARSNKSLDDIGLVTRTNKAA